MLSKKKSGISMIVLIITIIVSVILLSVVLLNIERNNPIDSAKEVRFKNDIDNFINEISITYTNKKTENLKYNFTDMDATIGRKTDDDKYEIEEYIPSITEEYVDRLGLKDGQLVYREIDFSEEEAKWLEESGVQKIE